MSCETETKTVIIDDDLSFIFATAAAIDVVHSHIWDCISTIARTTTTTTAANIEDSIEGRQVENGEAIMWYIHSSQIQLYFVPNQIIYRFF